MVTPNRVIKVSVFPIPSSQKPRICWGHDNGICNWIVVFFSKDHFICHKRLKILNSKGQYALKLISNWCWLDGALFDLSDIEILASRLTLRITTSSSKYIPPNSSNIWSLATSDWCSTLTIGLPQTVFGGVLLTIRRWGSTSRKYFPWGIQSVWKRMVTGFWILITDLTDK